MSVVEMIVWRASPNFPPRQGQPPTVNGTDVTFSFFACSGTVRNRKYPWPAFRPGAFGLVLRVPLENGPAEPRSRGAAFLQLFQVNSKSLDQAMPIDNHIDQLLPTQRFQIPHANIVQRFCSKSHDV